MTRLESGLKYTGFLLTVTAIKAPFVILNHLVERRFSLTDRIKPTICRSYVQWNCAGMFSRKLSRRLGFGLRVSGSHEMRLHYLAVREENKKFISLRGKGLCFLGGGNFAQKAQFRA